MSHERGESADVRAGILHDLLGPRGDPSQSSNGAAAEELFSRSKVKYRIICGITG